MNSIEDVSTVQLPRKTDPEEYDLVVLGSGAGSKFAAWTLAEQGQRVATIERRYIGGSCPNIACLPSKNIIHSAKVAQLQLLQRDRPAAPQLSGGEVVLHRTAG
jgi:pyruvate/2-oxoglutarate dehydrogenase complex dihydrolipoamide dehydrogenase (E3) component